MSRELWSDLLTEEIEAVMRLQAEVDGENQFAPGWLIGAFERAYADPDAIELATFRAEERLHRIQNPPAEVLDQGELFGEAA